MGGFRKVAGPAADKLLDEARAVEQAGAFAIVLEMIPPEIAAEITQALTIPTIGIGAGPHCDGQVLVSYDALGLFDEFTPSFVKRYAELGRRRSGRPASIDLRSAAAAFPSERFL
jgi:3-methyl-2-oxobutanoate hydroxymethyltransferase